MANMSLCLRLIFFALLVSQVKYTDGLVLTVFKTIVDVGKLALGIVEAVNKKNHQERIEKQLFELDHKVAGYVVDAKNQIIGSILENSKMEELDNIVRYVDSSMTDMKKIIEAENQTYAELCKEDFVRRFREHHMVKLVRDLKKLITYNNVVQEFALLPHLVKKTRCNLTKLKNFALFYLNLVSDGIALQAMYGKITRRSFSLHRLEKDEWAAALKKIENEFNTVEKDCIGKFSELAEADFRSATSAEELGQNNTERYIYTWTDVMFYAPYHGYEFHCFRASGKSPVFHQWRTNGQNKLAVYGPRGKIPKKWDARNISLMLAISGIGAPDPKDKGAAETVLTKVDDILKKKGYYSSTIIVYFVGKGYLERGTFKDKDSPVATYTLPGVTLRYCHKTAFECFFSRGRASGKYKIFVYP